MRGLACLPLRTRGISEVRPDPLRSGPPYLFFVILTVFIILTVSEVERSGLDRRTRQEASRYRRGVLVIREIRANNPLTGRRQAVLCTGGYLVHVPDIPITHAQIATVPVPLPEAIVTLNLSGADRSRRGGGGDREPPALGRGLELLHLSPEQEFLFRPSGLRLPLFRRLDLLLALAPLRPIHPCGQRRSEGEWMAQRKGWSFRG